MVTHQAKSREGLTKETVGVSASVTKFLILGIVIGLIVGGVSGYLISNSFHKTNFPARGNFQTSITDAAKAEVSSVFASQDSSQISSYCQQNRMNCAYYCRTMAPTDSSCAGMMNFSRRGS